jgi:ribosomal protein S2
MLEEAYHNDNEESPRLTDKETKLFHTEKQKLESKLADIKEMMSDTTLKFDLFKAIHRG